MPDNVPESTPVTQPTTPARVENTASERTRVNPADTHHATAQVNARIRARFLAGGPERSKARGSTVALPIVSAVTGGTLAEAVFGVGNVVNAHVLPPFVGAAVAGVLSPISSVVRRLQGESFGRMAAKMAINEAKGGLGTKFARGMENKMIRNIMFGKNQDVEDLLSYVNPQTKELDTAKLDGDVIDTDRAKKLIARGGYMGLMADTLKQLRSDWKPEDLEKFDSWKNIEAVSQQIYNKKLTPVEQDTFRRLEYENMVKKLELGDWTKGAVAMDIASMVKATGVVAALDIATSATVAKIAGGAVKLVTSAFPWIAGAKDFLVDKLSNADDFAKNLDTSKWRIPTPDEAGSWWQQLPQSASAATAPPLTAPNTGPFINPPPFVPADPNVIKGPLGPLVIPKR